MVGYSEASALFRQLDEICWSALWNWVGPDPLENDQTFCEIEQQRRPLNVTIMGAGPNAMFGVAGMAIRFWS